MSNTTFKKRGLIIESAADPAYLILTEENCFHVECIEEKEHFSQFLVLRLKEFLLRHHCLLSNLHFIAASQGPGSYTSLRVGGIVAKSLAYALKIPLLGFCSLAIYTPPMEGSFLVARDAKSRGLYLIEGRQMGPSTLFSEQVRLLSLVEAAPILEQSPCRLLPKNDALVQKFPHLTFTAVSPDFHHLTSMVVKNFPSTPISSFPQLDLLYL